MEKETKGGTPLSIGGILTGALVMYLLDPDRGRRRRAMLRDQFVHFGHQVRRDTGVVTMDILNRGKGFVAETRAAIRKSAVPDEVLKERVRSALGRAVSHPHAIDVEVQNGKVELKGFILEEEIAPMMAMIGMVRGVKEIEDQMQRGQHPEDMPSLQGGRPRRAWKPDILQTNQSPATRFILGTTGTLLARNGMRRGGFLGTLETVGGAAMLTRAVTNLDMSRLLGTSDEDVAQVNKTIEIHAPVDQVFNFWHNVENFPMFMEGLEDVQVLDDVRSRWTAKGPLGAPVTWTAHITNIEPDRRISWASESGSAVKTSGHVYFQKVDDNTTRVQVHISYSPPLGGLGHAVATMFLTDPKHRLDTDLLRLKSLIEDGKTSAKGHEVVRDEIEHPATELPLQQIGPKVEH